MQFSQIPTLLKLAFAALGGKNAIPVASQLPGNINGASYTDGFPPATRTALVAGGKPPAGLDVNGVLFDISSNVRWMNAGGPFPFSSDFATDANVGGYPQGAEIASGDLQGTWLSLNDSNTDNPDTGAGTKWVPGRAYGVTAVGGLTNANVTLTPAQAAKNRITLAGALTANVQIIFPTWLREWTVVNNTTGAFSVTAKTAAGSGIVLPAGQTKITGDGTNIVQPAENIAPATASGHAVQLSQVAASSLAQFRLSASGANLVLKPYRGNEVFSPGFGIVTIPSGGITLVPSGLTASTLYYIYLNPNGGAPVLVPSTTGHTTDATGVEVQTGNNSLVLVGMAWAATATSWEATFRSWRNDPGYSSTAVLPASSGTSSSTLVAINNALQLPFLLWSDEVALGSINCTCNVSVANTGLQVSLAVNGAAGFVVGSTPASTLSTAVSLSGIPYKPGIDSHDVANMFGSINSGATATWLAGQTNISLYIAPRA